MQKAAEAASIPSTLEATDEGHKDLIKRMAKAWNDEDLQYSENACKNMAYEWFELVDFDESLLMTQSKFIALVKDNLAVDVDEAAVVASFKKLDVNGDEQLSLAEFQNAIYQAL